MNKQRGQFCQVLEHYLKYIKTEKEKISLEIDSLKREVKNPKNLEKKEWIENTKKIEKLRELEKTIGFFIQEEQKLLKTRRLFFN